MKHDYPCSYTEQRLRQYTIFKVLPESKDWPRDEDILVTYGSCMSTYTCGRVPPPRAPYISAEQMIRREDLALSTYAVLESNHLA